MVQDGHPDKPRPQLFQTMYTCPGVADSLNHVPVSALSKAVVWSRNRTSGKNSTYFQELVKEQEFGMIAELNIPPGGKCRPWPANIRYGQLTSTQCGVISTAFRLHWH
jgi:hypothetical protein